MTSSGLPARKSGVSTGPGDTVLTVNPRDPRSLARTRATCSMAPFDATYVKAFGRTGVRPVKLDEKKIMRPPAIQISSVPSPGGKKAIQLTRRHQGDGCFGQEHWDLDVDFKMAVEEVLIYFG